MTEKQKKIKIAAICLAIFIIIVIVHSVLIFFGIVNTGKTKDIFETYEVVANVLIDASITDISIVSGDVFTVSAKHVSEKFTVTQNGNTLRIKDENHITSFRADDKLIEITVPEGLLNSLKINAGAGLLDIKNLNINLLELEQGAGTVTINNTTTNKTKIEGGAGKIYIFDSTLGNLDLDCGVGKTKIRGKILGRSDIDAGIGEIELELDGNEEFYSINAKKGLGTININGNKINDKQTIGTGENQIYISGGIGAINVTLN